MGDWRRACVSARAAYETVFRADRDCTAGMGKAIAAFKHSLSDVCSRRWRAITHTHTWQVGFFAGVQRYGIPAKKVGACGGCGD